MTLQSPKDWHRLLAWMLLLGLPSVLACDQTKTKPANNSAASSTKTENAEAISPDPLRNRATKPPSTIRWTDRTPSSGIVSSYSNGSESKNYSIIETLGGGVAIVDLDRDGNEDVILTQGGGFDSGALLARPLSCFRNRGYFNFQAIDSVTAIPPTRSFTVGVNAADFDQDGFADLHISGVGGHQLLRNQGDGTFDDVTASSGLNTKGFQASSAWGDFDGDGLIDLYTAHYATWSLDTEPKCNLPNGEREVCIPTQYLGADDELWIQTSDGSFRNESLRIKAKEPMRGMGVAAGDWDQDGDCDLYVANDIQPNLYFVNDGKGVFQEQGLQSGTSMGSNNTPDGSMGIAIGDFDGNLLPDILVTNFDGQYTELYQNLGKHRFRIGTRSAGLMALGNKLVGWGAAWFDAELDGDEDLFLVAGHPYQSQAAGSPKQKPVFLENVNRKRLEPLDQRDNEVLQHPMAARGLSTGDLDGDGDIDAVINCIGESCVVLENSTQLTANFVQIELIGRRSNRDALGASVICTTKQGKQLRCRIGGSSFASTNSTILHFGLGKDSQVDSIEVRWPSGSTSTLHNLAKNKRHVIVED